MKFLTILKKEGEKNDEKSNYNPDIIIMSI